MPPKILSDDQLKKHDIDTLKRFIRHKLGGYKVAIKDTTTDRPLYRGVLCAEPPATIDRVSYPPTAAVTKLGRVNRVGKSVFYCSVAAPAVFYELRAKQGDIIALSEWEQTEPLWMHNLGYHEAVLRKMGVRNFGIRSQLTNAIPNETKENAKLKFQLSRAFTEDIVDGQEYRYKQSIAINELLFDGASPLPTYADGSKYDRAAGTVYPAMRMHGAAGKLAIWPEFVDSSLRIKTVRHVLVEAADEASASYTFLNVGMSDAFSGREIVWQEAHLTEVQRRSHVAYEDGVWVMRDGLGRVYHRQD
jgi:hypothetical protein